MSLALTILAWVILIGLAWSILTYATVFIIQLCIARKVYKEIKKTEEEN